MNNKIIISEVNKKLSSIDTKKLPERIQFLIDLVGLNDTYLFVSSCSGKKLYIPKNPERSKLKKIISQRALNIISQQFSGEIIEVPKVENFHRLIRNLIIFDWIEQGRSNREISHAFELSYRQVVNIKKEHNENEKLKEKN
ncbi:hypothetical protein QU232_000698 [Vibrio vulnificus]|uniref:hypothetical protein n=1 Tax=Vibrio vulnificus TaxID=672 RepID=UPI0009B626FA|nr:hypothetical protein [Vibrio vulnificus]EIU7821206.1 hypothetical protein [Vibrio vulnificus]EIY8040098.1 hypothetical protein [Vibrio vulnificus]EIY8044465.1 hypothetical protein [Vibrio vulnificus]ELP1866573.1 hypothetical protein [Vibrio vulnificus]OQK34310.1 hypothetical protein XM72_c21173 [Vibrio vulnificus]